MFAAQVLLNSRENRLSTEVYGKHIWPAPFDRDWHCINLGYKQFCTTANDNNPLYLLATMYVLNRQRWSRYFGMSTEVSPFASVTGPENRLRNKRRNQACMSQSSSAVFCLLTFLHSNAVGRYYCPTPSSIRDCFTTVYLDTIGCFHGPEKHRPLIVSS